jgi:hypothetical protein
VGQSLVGQHRRGIGSGVGVSGMMATSPWLILTRGASTEPGGRKQKEQGSFGLPAPD